MMFDLYYGILKEIYVMIFVFLCRYLFKEIDRIGKND